MPLPEMRILDGFAVSISLLVCKQPGLVSGQGEMVFKRVQHETWSTRSSVRCALFLAFIMCCRRAPLNEHWQ